MIAVMVELLWMLASTRSTSRCMYGVSKVRRPPNEVLPLVMVPETPCIESLLSPGVTWAVLSTVCWALSCVLLEMVVCLMEQEAEAVGGSSAPVRSSPWWEQYRISPGLPLWATADDCGNGGVALDSYVRKAAFTNLVENPMNETILHLDASL